MKRDEHIQPRSQYLAVSNRSVLIDMKIFGRLSKQYRARAGLAAFLAAVLMVALLGYITLIPQAESVGHPLFRDENGIEDDMEIQEYPFFVKETVELGGQMSQEAASALTHRRSSKAASVLPEITLPESEFIQENLTESVDCTTEKALLKVFMYDLPPDFHFGMTGTKLELHDQLTWPQDAPLVPSYPGGLNQQHSPEYWLTLDLLTSHRSKHCTTIRVTNPNDADIFFVPFFSSLSYNRYGRMGFRTKNDELQNKLISYLLKQSSWSRSGGKDHVIVMHHPNSLHVARERLGSAMFIVADFGRYSSNIANIRKDIVAPYKHILPSFEDDSSTFENRSTLLFFQGAIIRKEGGIIRRKLYKLIRNEQGVRFEESRPRLSQGVKSATAGMRSSKFCLHLAGDTPSSNRLFDAIASHCVPVIISEQIELPYEDVLDYSHFCVFVRTADALRTGYLVDLLRRIRKKEWTEMWKKLKEVSLHFEYRYPSGEDDAVQMIWKSIAHRLPGIKQALHKAHRYNRSKLVHS